MVVGVAFVGWILALLPTTRALAGVITIEEGIDFATVVLHDRWDMGDSDDVYPAA